MWVILSALASHGTTFVGSVSVGCGAAVMYEGNEVAYPVHVTSQQKPQPELCSYMMPYYFVVLWIWHEGGEIQTTCILIMK